MSVKKLVLPNYIGKKLQICKMNKLHIFLITNICKPFFVNFGKIGTRGRCYDHNFLRFLPIFGEKIGVFSKTNFLLNLALL
jgi:hypothetical protein